MTTLFSLPESVQALSYSILAVAVSQMNGFYLLTKLRNSILCSSWTRFKGSCNWRMARRKRNRVWFGTWWEYFSKMKSQIIEKVDNSILGVRPPVVQNQSRIIQSRFRRWRRLRSKDDKTARSILWTSDHASSKWSPAPRISHTSPRPRFSDPRFIPLSPFRWRRANNSSQASCFAAFSRAWVGYLWTSPWYTRQDCHKWPNGLFHGLPQPWVMEGTMGWSNLWKRKSESWCCRQRWRPKWSATWKDFNVKLVYNEVMSKTKWQDCRLHKWDIVM